ncbi:hypothetical protein SK128_015553 [Halocaridina rubra]|uniref:Uncharacterized protein n=1 Tax=Halocaridina rubra TaxID=373956 RepID=A0AAN8X338_HALRR
MAQVGGKRERIYSFGNVIGTSNSHDEWDHVIIQDIVSICEGCDGVGDDSDVTDYSWPDIAQIFQESKPDVAMNDSISSLTEHIRMLSNIQPFERKYVNYSYIEDIEEKIECPEDELQTTPKTPEVSTTTTSTAEVSTAGSSIAPSSSLSSTVTVSTSSVTSTTSSTATTPTTYLSSGPPESTTSSTVTLPPSETQTTVISETVSEGSSGEITTEYVTSSALEISSSPPTIPLLTENKEDVIMQFDQEVDEDCEEYEILTDEQVFPILLFYVRLT